MISKLDKNTDRLARHARVRKKIGGTAERPRFDVYRSNMHIYVQVIDDVAGKTLAAASTVEKEIGKMVEGKSKTEAAKIVGAEAAKRAIAAGITEVVFDRGGYIYTGRVAAVADGARGDISAKKVFLRSLMNRTNPKIRICERLLKKLKSQDCRIKKASLTLNKQPVPI